MGAMHFISASIVRFVDPHQPGWVEGEFSDAAGRRHTLTDKVPIFTAEMLDAESTYPVPGKIPCEVLERFDDEMAQELVRVTTAKPCNIESADGLSEFTIFASLVSEEL
jgi:hypothetical protein